MAEHVDEGDHVVSDEHGRPLSARDLNALYRAGLAPDEVEAWARSALSPFGAEHPGPSRRKPKNRALSEPDGTPAVLAELRERCPASGIQYLVSLREIAELAGVEAQVISRWRSDVAFPTPVIGGRSPRFSVADVVQFLWSVRPRLGARPGRGIPSVTGWVWVLAVRAAATNSPGVVTRSALAELVGNAAGLQPPELDGLDRLARRSVAATDLARRLDDALAAGIGPSELLDDGLDELNLLETSSESNTTAHALAELMTALADPRAGMTVLAPAVGEGELLIWCGQHAGRKATLLGQDLAPHAVGIARVRMALRGLNADLRCANAFDSEAFRGVAADRVIVDPPMKAENVTIADWLSYTASHLAAGGRGVVLVPTNAVPQGTSRRAALDEMFDQRRVEALVLLPPPLRPGTRDFVAVCVLGAAGEFDQTLVVDLVRQPVSSASRQVTASRFDPSPRDWLPTRRVTEALDSFRSTGRAEWEHAAVWSASDLRGGGLKSSGRRDVPQRAAALRLIETLGDQPGDEQLIAQLRARFELS